MKSVVLFALLGIFVAAAFSQYQNVDEITAKQLFSQFVQKYNKRYSSLHEMNSRFENFKLSLQRITERNQKSKHAKYGITKFSDLAVDEFKNTILMKNTIKDKPQPEPERVLVPKVTSVPTYFDWRDKAAVTAVKNQEQCGSCWAFSATENIESMWILAGKGTNESVNFAPQQIVDCDDTSAGCNGGETESAYYYVIGAGGIEDNSSYPYVGVDEDCEFNANKVDGKISDWKYGTSWYNEQTMIENLVSWGPLSVCVDASSWQDYDSGVVTWEECAYINILDHCVQLVGYNNTGATPYYMVRNSWDTDWGVDGYIWLQMFEDTCGIAHDVTCAVV